MRGQAECGLFDIPPFGCHFDFGHGPWHRGHWPHRFGMDYQEFHCHRPEGPGPRAHSPGRHSPDRRERGNFGHRPHCHGPHHHGHRGHRHGHHEPHGYSPDRHGPHHHRPHGHNPDLQGPRHFGPGLNCNGSRHHGPHGYSPDRHGPCGPHWLGPFGPWGRSCPYDRRERPGRGSLPPCATRCCEDSCRRDRSKERPCDCTNKDQSTDDDSGHENERLPGRVEKQGKRKNKPCCSYNKDGNEKNNETVLVQRIVVEKAPRCYSV